MLFSPEFNRSKQIELVQQQFAQFQQELTQIITLDDLSKSESQKFLYNHFASIKSEDFKEIQQLSKNVVISMSNYITQLENMIGHEQYVTFLSQQIRFIVPFFLKKIQTQILNCAMRMQVLAGIGTDSDHQNKTIQGVKSELQDIINITNDALAQTQKMLGVTVLAAPSNSNNNNNDISNNYQKLSIGIDLFTVNRVLFKLVESTETSQSITFKEQDIQQTLAWLISSGKTAEFTAAMPTFKKFLTENSEFLLREQRTRVDFLCWAALFKQSEIMSLMLTQEFYSKDYLEEYAVTLLGYIAAGGSVECLTIFAEKVKSLSDMSEADLQEAALIALAKQNFSLYECIKQITNVKDDKCFFSCEKINFCIFGIHGSLHKISAIYLSNDVRFLVSDEMRIENVCKTIREWLSKETKSDAIDTFFYSLLQDASAHKNEQVIQHGLTVYLEIEKDYPSLLKLLTHQTFSVQRLLAKQIMQRVLDFSAEKQIDFLSHIQAGAFSGFKTVLISLYLENTANQSGPEQQNKISKLIVLFEQRMMQLGITEKTVGKDFEQVAQQFNAEYMFARKESAEQFKLLIEKHLNAAKAPVKSDNNNNNNNNDDMEIENRGPELN